MSNFSNVQDTLNKILGNQPNGVSAQLVVLHKGEKVVDLNGSSAGTPPNRLDTRYITFSVSKGFTTAAILKLLDERLIELDTPIATYWTEFGQGGKESATIRHALVHQAGIPAPHFYRQIPYWPFWNLVTRKVAKYPALYQPGTQTSYHLVNFGFILGEVVRRVTGMPIDQYLQVHFFEPMGLKNIRMRIPAKEENVSPRVISISKSMRNTARLFNLHTIRRSLIPAAGLHSNASNLAEFFSMLLHKGNYQNCQFLSPEIIKEATSTQYDGYDTYLRSNVHWGLGYIIGGGQFRDPDPRKSAMGYGSSENTFASFGMGTCMVWADRDHDLVSAFTTNGMLADQQANQRWADLSNSIWDAILN